MTAMNTNHELTRDEAIAFFDAEKWKPMSPVARIEFQLRQPCLCMPFGEFKKSIEHVLGRSIVDFEFYGNGMERIQAELARKGVGLAGMKQ